MDTDYIFIIRTYPKNELARMYCPGLSLESALRMFRIWIDTHPELSQRLLMTGYKSRNRYFTPKQVEIIRECLGDP